MKPLHPESSPFPLFVATRPGAEPPSSLPGHDLTDQLLAVSDGFRIAAATLFEASPHAMGPTGASCALSLERLADTLGPLPLEPFLCDALRRCVRSRQLAFVAGRLCAERALRAIGTPWPRRVARGATGQPCWPAATLGSITHTATTAHAAVRPAAGCFGIGIDSELVDTAATAAVTEFCCTPFERTRWLASSCDEALFVLIFSAKEAFYKAAHRSVGRFIGFDEAEVVALDPSRGTLVLQPVTGGELASRFAPMTLRYSIERTLPARVHTTLVIDCAPRFDA
jgi:enterobactin synthetase component D